MFLSFQTALNNPKESKEGSQQTKHVWSKQQTTMGREYFAKHIGLGKVPQKHECDACRITYVPFLDSKSWRNIKYKVYNIIQSNKRV